MTALIRQAQQQDVESLCCLVHAFHEFHVKGLPTRLATLGELEMFDSSELIARLLQVIDHPESAVFIAEIDSQLVGFVELICDKMIQIRLLSVINMAFCKA